MRGKILAFDFRAGEGHISGDDGQRYRFAAAEWKPPMAPASGQAVDFEAAGREALAIYPLDGPLISGEKSKIAAALLAIFLGTLGIHKFYLNKNGSGLVMLLISVFGLAFAGLPTALMSVIAFIEGIIYLTHNDEDFERLYVRGNKAWF